MRSQPTLRRRFFALLIPLVFSQACFQMNACDFDDCESDADCPDGSVCVTPAWSIGLQCVEGKPCLSDADCPDGVTCEIRAANEPDHPFEQGIGERGICGCDDLYCEGYGGSGPGTTSTSTSTLGGGGAGEGGSAGAGGAPGVGGGAAQGSGGAGEGGGSGGQGGAS